MEPDASIAMHTSMRQSCTTGVLAGKAVVGRPYLSNKVMATGVFAFTSCLDRIVYVFAMRETIDSPSQSSSMERIMNWVVQSSTSDAANCNLNLN